MSGTLLIEIGVKLLKNGTVLAGNVSDQNSSENPGPFFLNCLFF